MAQQANEALHTLLVSLGGAAAFGILARIVISRVFRT